jgi:excisionase family DNA binding protein
MTTAQKTWLTRAEAAERAGISLRTVDRWLSNGTLTRYTNRNRRVRINADELKNATDLFVPERSTA